ncbi:acetylglutamate kinase [Rhodohalobacter sp. SW132]|nr:acetylglutamate kinase [Rhodohalobacter sp. SW132]
MASADLNYEIVKSFNGKVVVIKYGGNAMTDSRSQEQVLNQVAEMKTLGIYPVVVHGGGPVIKALFEQSGIDSEFVDGHRITLKNSMEVVEQALSGKVNGELVNRLNRLGANAVGLSGKDGGLVKARKRIHNRQTESGPEEIDLGFVGDVDVVNPDLLHLLIKNGYLPVISPVSGGENGDDYNINADMFAGHIAGALQAEAFVAITNVDGLMEDPDRPETKIVAITSGEVKKLFGSVIQGGMIPKIEACNIALDKGVKAAHIVNGAMDQSILLQLFTEKKSGTTIKKE